MSAPGSSSSMWQMSTPFPVLPVSALTTIEFSMPVEWLLTHGTSHQRAAKATIPGGHHHASKAAIEAAAAELFRKRMAGNRRTTDVIVEENRQAGADASLNCLMCQRSEAICTANTSELAKLDREWRNIWRKRLALTTPHLPTGTGTKSEQTPNTLKKEGMKESKGKVNGVVSEATPAPGASDAQLPQPTHPALLRCDRLCAYHQLCLLDPPPNSSQSGSTSDHPIAARPIPPARNGPSTTTPTWSALDQLSFNEAYTLPSPSAGPSTIKKEVQGADMEEDTNEVNVKLEPGLTSPRKRSRQTSNNANGATAASDATASDSIHASPLAAASSSSDSQPRKKKKSTMASQLHIDMALDFGSAKNDLPIPMVDDSGRRSGRVQQLLQEQESKSAELAKERAEQRRKKEEEERRAAETAAVARVKDTVNVAPKAASARDVAATLMTFPSLLSLATPDGLLYHCNLFQHQPLPLDHTPNTSALPIPPIHLCMRTLEVASFTTTPANLAKSTRISSTHTFTLALNTLKQILTEEKQLPKPIESLSYQLLTPDVLGLTPLHTAIRLGQIEIIQLLLSDLPLGDFTSDLTITNQDLDQIQSAPVERKSTRSSSPTIAPVTSRTNGSPMKHSRVKLETVPSQPDHASTKNGRKRVKVESSAAITPSPSTPTTDSNESSISTSFNIESESNHSKPASQSSIIVPTYSSAQIAELFQQRSSALRQLVGDQLSTREAATKFGLTPFLYAIYIGVDDRRTLTVLESLVELGANPFDTDYLGRDALHWCAIKSFPSCIKFMIETWAKHDVKMKDKRLQELINSQDEKGNSSLHYAITSMMDVQCAGCPQCVQLYVRASESSAQRPPTDSLTPPTQTSRSISLSTLPPFVLTSLLKLQPLLRNPVLLRLVQQTMWKNELRIAKEMVYETDDGSNNSKSLQPQMNGNSHHSNGESKSNDEDVEMSDATTPSLSTSSTPAPTVNGTAAPSSSLPDYLSPNFVSLLRLWRTLLHRESKSVEQLRLSPLVLELAQLLPLGMFLEPLIDHSPNAEGEEELTLVQSTRQCSRIEQAYECVHQLLKNGGDSSLKNQHGLNGSLLMYQWTSQRQSIQTNRWYAKVKKDFHSLLSPIESMVDDTKRLPPLSTGMCVPELYIQPAVSSQPSVAVNAIKLEYPVPCSTCGAGRNGRTDPFHWESTASIPTCVCYRAPTFNAKDKLVSHLTASQREKYHIPMLNAFDGDSTSSLTSVLPHSYTRCSIFADGQLQENNATRQPTTDSLACACMNGCTSQARCPCATHRFGTTDPVIHRDPTGVHLTGTTTSIFECQPLCQCKCVLGGPDITDVQRFHLRFRIQILRHLSGWYVHTLESIPRGSFVMEYTCEILTDTQATLRQLEYSTCLSGAAAINEQERFIIRIQESHQTDRDKDKDNRTHEEMKRLEVLNKISFDGTRFGNTSTFLRTTCVGNLTPVLFYPHGQRIPKILLYANTDIRPGQELTLQHQPQECLRRQIHGSHDTTHPGINLVTA